MTNDDVEKKAAPVRVAKKSDGWREREEAKAAGVTPRTVEQRQHDEHSLVRA